jgi:putative heme iron utilization protein
LRRNPKVKISAAARPAKAVKTAASIGKTAPARQAARHARLLLRRAKKGVLATVRANGWPYASLVLVATGGDGVPVFLLSKLAEHTKNFTADDRVSLFIEDTARLRNPLTGPRLCLLGRLRPSADAKHRQRFLARHPSAKRYAQFGDFRFYRLEPQSAHLIQGFGRIHWIEGRELRTRTPPKKRR